MALRVVFSGCRALPRIQCRMLSTASILRQAEKASEASAQTSSKSTQWVGLTNDQDFFTKNEKLHRPMSPHLTIYRFPLPAILSIAHRGSGIMLTGAVCAAGIGLAFHPLQFYVDAVQAMQLPGAVYTAGKFSLAFPFVYHSFNGVRHLVWDVAKGLTLPDLYKTGYATVGVSALVAFGLALL